jgi:hypothetical protein
MKTAYFDCFAGISGDMIIGALLDTGVEFRALEAELRKLNVAGYELRMSKVIRAGISATRFDVILPVGQSDGPPHSHAAASGSSHGHLHEHGASPHRSLSEIVHLIEDSSISSHAKVLSQRIFERLGAVEAGVHGIPVERVHFHEVGAVDSIADIVGSAICLDWLNVEKIIASPVNVGSGFVQCEHGKFPVPAPATAELLKFTPVFSSGPEVELTTPTGAAILTTVADEFRRARNFRSTHIGYGAGSREFEDFPNTLRVFIGEEESTPTADLGAGDESVIVVEANIDDMNPQIYGHFLEKALAAGALDVFIVPIQMKKNRPGHCITVICQAAKLDEFTQLIFSETTTIGLRFHSVHRRVLSRTFDSVDTVYGKIGVKVSRLDGSVMTASPEYDDCRRLAQEKSVPLKDVLAEANAQIRKLKI